NPVAARSRQESGRKEAQKSQKRGMVKPECALASVPSLFVTFVPLCGQSLLLDRAAVLCPIQSSIRTVPRGTVIRLRTASRKLVAKPTGGVAPPPGGSSAGRPAPIAWPTPRVGVATSAASFSTSPGTDFDGTTGTGTDRNPATITSGW